jgi:ABC-2 type transport system permease protein/oleandomycin transport system permease protein
VPVDNMPPVLEAFANVNPFTITVDAMRHLFVGTPAGNSVWGATLWSLGLIAVFAPIAVLKYRRVSAR